tara:strand:+ start:389 stop:895 length:507 start_codon:yes stop_codon:yes gene_type:complete
MAYFKTFPKLFYPTGKTKTVVPDIFRRVHMDKFFANRTNLTGYFISDGQTPELVSQDVYGSTQYHWIVLLANDIIDVQREWPKSQEELTLYVKDKYGANNSSDIHHYVLTADKSIVVDWDAAKASDGTYTALTNLQYEEEVNDKKRQIKVLNPLFLSAVSKQFNRLMK